MNEEKSIGLSACLCSLVKIGLFTLSLWPTNTLYLVTGKPML